MITVLIKGRGPGGEDAVRGVVYPLYDPAWRSPNVAARRPDPEKITELVEERLPLLACVRNLKRLFGLPPRKIRSALGPGEHLRLETGPMGRGSP